MQCIPTTGDYWAYICWFCSP